MNGVIHAHGLAIPDMPILDARDHPDKEALLEAIGNALGFPEYYGANWDALEECLTDLSWHEGPLQLALRHADTLDEDLRDTLLDIFQEAARHWAASNKEIAIYLL